MVNVMKAVAVFASSSKARRVTEAVRRVAASPAAHTIREAVRRQVREALQKGVVEVVIELLSPGARPASDRTASHEEP